MLLVLRDKPSLIRLMFVNETLFVFRRTKREIHDEIYSTFQKLVVFIFTFYALLYTVAMVSTQPKTMSEREN